MQNEDEEYRRKVETYSLEDLSEVLGNMDREKYPKRYEMVRQELTRRGQDGEARTTSDPVSGIGGWLILPLIGLLVSPFLIAYNLFQSLQALLNFRAMAILQDPGSSLHIPHFSLFFAIEITFELFLLGFSLWTTRLFLLKKRATVRFMIWILAANALFAVFEYGFSLFFFQNFQDIQTETAKTFLQATVRAAVWIPYFIKSERVKNTFVE